MQTYAIQALKTWQQGKARTFSDLEKKPHDNFTDVFSLPVNR